MDPKGFAIVCFIFGLAGLHCIGKNNMHVLVPQEQTVHYFILTFFRHNIRKLSEIQGYFECTFKNYLHIW